MPADLLELAWKQIWQVTLLALAIAALVALCGRNRPHLAHALWLAVLLKCLTPPLWSSSLGLFCWLQPVATVTNSEPVLKLSARISMAPNQNMGVDIGEISERLPNDFPNTLESAAPKAEDLPANASQVRLRSSPSVLRTCFVPLAAGVWLIGCLVRMTYTLARSIGCWRSIIAATRPAPPELLEALERLRLRLRIRRRMRLVVSATRIGPAVVGLFRPTIVLPEIIMAGRPGSDLEPILAHELIHVRRGDLWVGCMQTLICGLWWFHPLVRGVGRALAREAERCVDEELIAELHCDPARYARTLLAVLELKQTLRPVPVFPGMKPVEITSKRLERIMSLRQGCRNHTPWWCWIALTLVLAATLPGRALVAVGEPGAAGERKPTAPTTSAGPGRTAAENGAEELQMRLYHVADLAVPLLDWVTIPRLEWVTAEYSRSDSGQPAPWENVERQLTTPDKPVIDLNPVRKLIETTVAPQTWNSAGGAGQIQPDSATFSLIIRQTPQVHQQIATLLADLRREEDVQVTLELKLVRLSDNGWLKRLGWSESSERLVEGIVLSRDRAEEFKKLEQLVSDGRRTPLLKVTLFNEQVAEFTFSHGDEKPAASLAVAMGVAVDNDRQGVRLNLACNATNREQALAGARSFRLAIEESLLIDVGPEAAAAQKIKGVPILTKTPHLSRWFKNAQAQSNAGKPVQPLMLLVVPRIIVM